MCDWCREQVYVREADRAERCRRRICHYCPAEATTWDHIVPKALGGPRTKDNLVPACVDCNRKKGHQLPTCGCEKCRAALARYGRNKGGRMSDDERDWEDDEVIVQVTLLTGGRVAVWLPAPMESRELAQRLREAAAAFERNPKRLA